ncbi:dynamin family protein [Leuconostoc pseudomesenteroides]|uniref:dynamin family protein n=1 Tax=Leuconostoc pseudomesenteroides TaxID=33968 RepID=UPI0039E8E311
MNNQNFSDFKNLKIMREKLGLTIAEVATRMNVTSATVINWEKNPGNMSIDKLYVYAGAIGLELKDLFEPEDNSIPPIKIEDSTNFHSLRKKLITYFNYLQKESNTTEVINETTIQIKYYYAGFMKELTNILYVGRKPVITFVGPSDAGKSTMINTLLYNDILKAHWTPATSVAIHIVHTDDKPRFLDSNTLVAKRNKSEMPIQSWQLNNYDFYKSHVVEHGDRDILSSWGDREGTKYQPNLMDTYTVFTYVTSDFLKNVELIDTPGINASDDAAGDMDRKLSIYSQTDSDIVVALSPINQFLDVSDTSYFSQTVKRLDHSQDYKGGLSAWHNLFIVASQASIVLEDVDRTNILSKGADRLANTIGDRSFDIHDHYTKNEFKERFFTFSRDDKNISNRFIKSLKETIEKKQILNYETANSIFLKFRDDAKKALKRSEKQILQDRDNRQDTTLTLAEVKKELALIKDNNSNLKQNILDAIPNLRIESRHQFDKYYKNLMSEEHLVALIEEHNISNKKDAKKNFMSWLGGQIQEKFESILEHNGKKFAEAVNNLGAASQKDLEDAKYNFNSDNTIKFDYTGLISGLAGAGVVGGAFALLAGSITSNLGLYITVAQVGGILTSLGIISSPITATAAVAATGGPIGWVISLTILAGTGISWLISSATWKNKFAKQVIKSYSKQDAEKQFMAAIDKYWDDTENTTNDMIKVLDKLAETEVKNYQERFEATIDDITINNGFKQLKKLTSIVDNMN